MQDLHGSGENRLQSERAHADFKCTGTQRKAVTPQEPWLDLPVGCGGSPGEAGVGCGSLWEQGHWWQRPKGIPIGVSSPGGLLAPRPGPAHYSAGTSRTKQPARQEHTDSPPISRQDAWSYSELTHNTKWNKPNKERQISYDISYVWNPKNWYKGIYVQNRNRLTDFRNKSMITKGER